MIWRWRRHIACFTALLMGLVSIACACGMGQEQIEREATLNVDPHACCKPTSDLPTPAQSVPDDCPHCGKLTVAPAKAPDRTPDISTGPILAAIAPELALAAPFVIASAVAWISDSAPAATLLSLSCALRL
ncbi:MAG: hypothetical protein WBD40_08210 [Tepidisphaeraceae bacterium]